VAAIPEDTVTGFQLNDILIENYSEEQLLSAIQDRVKQTRERIKRAQDPRVIADAADEDDLKDETEEEKSKRYGHPDYDLEKLFKEVGAEDSLEKLKEHKIVSVLFWTLEEKELREKLEVKVFGAEKKLFMRREQIKKNHRKAMEKADEDKDKLNEEDKRSIQQLLQC